MRTYGAIALVNDRWVISALDAHVRIRLKHIFPRIPKTADVPYVLPNDLPHAADIEWFLSRYPLRISPDDRMALIGGRLRFETRQTELERILAADYAPPAYPRLKPGAEVRHYQSQAVEVLFRSFGLLLGDEVGLGKTFTTAAACLNPDALPAIVVCHPHLQKQWIDVIHGFTTLNAYGIKKTKPYELPPADVFVFRYSQLAGWVDRFADIGPKLVAYDEVQELRTGTASAKGVAALRLSNLATYRLGLSATPIYNYGNEIWEVMRFLRPDALGDYYDFVREWTGNSRTVSNPKALGTYLREQFAFLRRTKRDVGKEMPPVNRIVDMIEHDEAKLRDIDELAHQLAVRTTVGEFTDRGQAARELDMLVRQQTGIAKAKGVAAFARILVEGGEPIALVGWHREVYDIWLEELAEFRPAMYTGSESPAGKNREKDRFISGDTDILIMSLRSGAGLDGLQFRCSTMVFGELDWSPGIHHQCVGRLDREGQADPVTAIFLVTDDGSDPPIMEMLGLKASQAAGIADPELGVQTVHSDISRVQALVSRYLKRKKRGPVDNPEQERLAI
jgi:SNF2 family DNA or RNA helicase